MIFISIDDNEVAQLKLVCDEIFGEENFAGEVIRKTKSMTGDEGTGFNNQHESLIIYAKNKDALLLSGEPKTYKEYKNPDNDPRGEWKSGDPSAKSGGDSTYFEIVNPYTGKVDLPPAGRYWAFSKSTLENYIASKKVVFKEKHPQKERGFIFKAYKSELKTDKNPVDSLFANDNQYMNQVGTKELKELFDNQELFNNPKPVIFVQKLIQYTTDKDATILDFFAGSGTTAHAVMELNKEDGGDRKFICVQWAEKTPENSQAYKAGYKTVFDITKERIDRAGEKIASEAKDANLLDVEYRTKLNSQGLSQLISDVLEG